jgi:hypothetical protein
VIEYWDNIDIKLIKKPNMYGLIFEVNSLAYDELELYIGELIEFEGQKYMVKTVNHLSSEKRESRVYIGSKLISKSL